MGAVSVRLLLRRDADGLGHFRNPFAKVLQQKFDAAEVFVNGGEVDRIVHDEISGDR